MSLNRPSHRNKLKTQKVSKNYEQLEEKQIIEPLESLAIT